MSFTDQHAHDLRRLESDTRLMASWTEPDSCHWRVSGPPAEISNTPEYQALCSQAITLQVKLSSWKRFFSNLMAAQESVWDAAMEGDDEQNKLGDGIAYGMKAGIGSARQAYEWAGKQLAIVKAEMKRLEDEFYRSEE